MSLFIFTKPYSILRICVFVVQVSRTVGSTFVSPLRDLLIEVLINALFFCHQDHAIKSAINGIIRHLPETNLQTISSLVKENLENNEILDNIDGVELVGSLVLCNIGQSAIFEVYQTITSHIKCRIKYFVGELEQTNSPTETAKIHNDLHSVVRTLLSVIRLEQFVGMKLDAILLEDIVSVLHLDGIPLEVQGNSSKIVTIITAAQGKGIESLIQQISGEATASLRIQLNICHGVMSSLDKDVLLSCSQAKGTLLGSVVLPIIMKSQEDG